MIRKIQSFHLYWFHACLNMLTCCLVQNMIKHYLRSHMSLEFETLVQNGSNSSGHSCTSPIHPFCHVSCMHHSVAHCLVLIVLSVLSAVGPAPEEYREYLNEEQYQTTDLPGKQPPI